jgi:hypothetical protein
LPRHVQRPVMGLTDRAAKFGVTQRGFTNRLHRFPASVHRHELLVTPGVRAGRTRSSRAALVPAYAVASRTRRTPDRYSCSESTVRRQAVNAAAGACRFCEHEGGSARGDPARALSAPRALGERARQRRCNPAQATSSVLGARMPWRARPAAASMQQRRRADRRARWGRGSGRAGRGEPSDLPLEWAHVARPRLGDRTAISDPTHCELSDPSIGHQLQMPTVEGVSRGSLPATHAPSSTEWVTRHRCLRSDSFAEKKTFERALG